MPSTPILLPALSPVLLQPWGFQARMLERILLSQMDACAVSTAASYLPPLIIFIDSRILQGPPALPEVVMCELFIYRFKREQGTALPRLRLRHCLSHARSSLFILNMELSGHLCMPGNFGQCLGVG